MKDNKKNIAIVVASADVFDFLREKVGERKTRTEAYYDLLDKSLAGFVSELQRRTGYDLQPNQCHVTISGLAEEWHWHRATVRSFLEMLEQLGQLEKVKLPKSIVITMPVGLDKVLKPECGQPFGEFDLTLDSALSGWIIGKMTSNEAGWMCEQIIREYLDKGANPSDGQSPDNDSELTEREIVQLEDDLREKAMACIARAALTRVLRKSHQADIAPMEAYFHTGLGEDWAALIDTFKALAELLADGETDHLGRELEENDALRDSLYKSFQTLLGRKAAARQGV